MGRRGGERKKGRGQENLTQWDRQIERRTERESKERDILIEKAIMGLARNLELEKYLEIHKNDFS